MNFAMYYPWLSVRGGAERVMLEIVMRTRHDWTLYTHHYDAEKTFPEFAHAPIVELAPGIDPRGRLLFLRAATTIARTVIPAHHDGLLVSSEGLSDLVALRTALPSACFCHTPLKTVFDDVTRSNLSVYNPRLKAALAVLGPLFRLLDRRAWRRYRHVLVNSLETERRVRAARLLPYGPLEVLHPGVDHEVFVPGGARRGRLFVVAGRINPQKQIEIAIEAFADEAVRATGAELVVAGCCDETSEAYLRDLRRRAAGLTVRFELNPTDQQMAELYATATALLFTPPNEDWGIVALEAMAAGTPVIASAGGGALESVVDGATGWLVPPEPAAFSAKVLLALHSDLEPLRTAARQRALAFGWEGFVARIDEVMEELVSSVGQSHHARSAVDG